MFRAKYVQPDTVHYNRTFNRSHHICFRKKIRFLFHSISEGFDPRFVSRKLCRQKYYIRYHPQFGSRYTSILTIWADAAGGQIGENGFCCAIEILIFYIQTELLGELTESTEVVDFIYHGFIIYHCIMVMTKMSIFKIITK